MSANNRAFLWSDAKVTEYVCRKCKQLKRRCERCDRIICHCDKRNKHIVGHDMYLCFEDKIGRNGS